MGALGKYQEPAKWTSFYRQSVGSCTDSNFQLAEALERIGYTMEVAVITCNIQEALRRNASRATENI
jgi:hypothetical protein